MCFARRLPETQVQEGTENPRQLEIQVAKKLDHAVWMFDSLGA